MHQVRTMDSLPEHSRFRSSDTGLILELLECLPIDRAQRRQEPVHRARREASEHSQNVSPLHLGRSPPLRYHLVDRPAGLHQFRDTHRVDFAQVPRLPHDKSAECVDQHRTVAFNVRA